MHIHTSDQEPLVLGFGGDCCNWGVHLCGFYETEAERDEIITENPFFQNRDDWLAANAPQFLPGSLAP